MGTMDAHSITTMLGAEVDDPSEETFLLFSQDAPSQSLGMIDPSASSLEVAVGKQDFTIKQSPAVLNSTREGGTTGAVVWKVTPRFADWLVVPGNILFRLNALSSEATVLELGSGIAGIVPVMLAPLIKQYLATDQSYALKLLKENIAQNSTSTSSSGNGSSKKRNGQGGQRATSNIETLPLDWESDDVKSLLDANSTSKGVDLIVACDCIYNYALIQPFVQTCVDVCQWRATKDRTRRTFCVVAQQLRQPDVFEEWLETFHNHFRTWRVPDEALTPDLREGSGFAVHLGVLRDQT